MTDRAEESRARALTMVQVLVVCPLINLLIIILCLAGVGFFFLSFFLFKGDENYNLSLF